MQAITLNKKQQHQIDEGIQIEFTRYGFTFFAVKDEYGDFKTPNGTRFMIGIFNPTDYDLEVNYR